MSLEVLPIDTVIVTDAFSNSFSELLLTSVFNVGNPLSLSLIFGS